jgi:predicted ATPase
MAEVQKLLSQSRLVTLTGAGGVGKTRLAVEVASQLAAEYADGVWYVDLAPITAPAVVPVTVARALGLPDQPGRSTMDMLLRFIRDRQVLAVLDNCEHLLDACAELVVALLSASPGLTLLATSREPLGVAGEATWRVPSLSVADEAVELFADRARLAQTGFTISDDNAAVVAEICQRLDGMPLAIELAAARVRALSLAEVLDSLHDRFRLLTGGARTAVRRQQTLRASVDWSHALLTEPEQVLFRRLAAFMGGFDLKAAQAVAGSGAVERYQVIDQLTRWWTNRWWWPKTPAAQRDTGYWRRCANTRRKNSPSPAKPMPCGRVTATTTPRWRPCSTRRQAVITTGVSSRPNARSTICAPRSCGAAKTPISSWLWRWRPRCSRCG